jgi:hypothetical protein
MRYGLAYISYCRFYVDNLQLSFAFTVILVDVAHRNDIPANLRSMLILNAMKSEVSPDASFIIPLV